MERPFVSDSERWMLGAGVSREEGRTVQHIYVKPVDIALEATLIINTDRRVYHLILRSFKDVHMPKVRWRYPSAGLPENYAPAPAGEAGGSEAGGGEGGDEAGEDNEILDEEARDRLEAEGHFLKLLNMPRNTVALNVTQVTVANSAAAVSVNIGRNCDA